MFISKRKNGIYYLCYHKADGKRTNVSTKTKKKSEAMIFFRDFAQVERENRINGFIPISLKDFTWRFLKHSESIHSINTTKTFKTTFNAFNKFNNDIELANVDRRLLHKYFDYRLKTTGIYQVRKDRINLSSLFNRAVDEGYLLENPISAIKPFKIPEKQPVFFSNEEYSVLLETIKEEDIRDLVIFAVNTGLRQMELLTLEWSQINVENKLLTLDNRNHLTKTKKVRTIPLNIKAFNIIEKRKGLHSQLVFTLFGEPMTQDSIANRFHRIINKSGLNPKLNFHSLRHTFASWLAQKGISIYHISKLLGHSNVKTTEIYAHLNNEDLRNSVTVL